jgi:hypothetical protein
VLAHAVSVPQLRKQHVHSEKRKFLTKQSDGNYVHVL